MVEKPSKMWKLYLQLQLDELKCIFVKTSVCQYLYKRIKTKSFTRHKSHNYSLIWTCRKTSLCFQHENGIWILLSDIQMKYCQSFSILKYKLFNIYSCSQMPLRARLLNALTTVTVYTYLGLIKQIYNSKYHLINHEWYRMYNIKKVQVHSWYFVKKYTMFTRNRSAYTYFSKLKILVALKRAGILKN